MKRSPFKRKAAKPKRAKPLVAKALGKSRVKKGPARDEKHLQKVREQPCMVCGFRPVEAHHVRCLSPRTMGVRKSDYHAVPLCNWHHLRIHDGNEQSNWELWGINPSNWILNFSPEGKAALEALTRDSMQARGTG